MITSVMNYFATFKKVNLEAIDIILDHIYKSYFFNFMANVDDYAIRTTNFVSRDFKFSQSITVSLLIGLLLTVSFFFCELKFASNAQKKKAEILSIFFKIPRADVKRSIRQSAKLCDFCNVSSLDFDN
jgi:hypothetical protein